LSLCEGSQVVKLRLNLRGLARSSGVPQSCSQRQEGAHRHQNWLLQSERRRNQDQPLKAHKDHGPLDPNEKTFLSEEFASVKLRAWLGFNVQSEGQKAGPRIQAGQLHQNHCERGELDDAGPEFNRLIVEYQSCKSADRIDNRGNNADEALAL
jgi:hypothetical protein